MKDITLKIIGRQKNKDGEEENMEFITEGKLYERGNATYLIYDESEFSGFPGCKTSLKLVGNNVKMKRIGESAGGGTELVFQEGHRFSGQYHTPFGDVAMEVLTNRVENKLSEEGYGSVEVDYEVSVEGLLEGHNELKIHVME